MLDYADLYTAAILNSAYHANQK